MGSDAYVPDRLFARLFQPWTLPESEWPLCREDWIRVDVISNLPWKGELLDFGAGDGTLSALARSRNPGVVGVTCIEQDEAQRARIHQLWRDWEPVTLPSIPMDGKYDGALCCECLEHMSEKDGREVLEELHSMLMPGSLLCVTVPYPEGSRQPFPGHIRRIYGADLWRYLEAAGFTVKGVRLINGDDLLPIWLMATAVARA
jgi:2-polyprenyl-3-methyl-5-hydroxy-6-metoxy-1,4-benzoquinol methylase